jgi:hypothetical protein
MSVRLLRACGAGDGRAAAERPFARQLYEHLCPFLAPELGLYFGGNAITTPIIVLSIYVVIGGALMTYFSWGRGG